MSQQARYSLTAIAVLAVAVLGLIIFRAKIMADINPAPAPSQIMGVEAERVETVALKAGWNYFKNSDFAVSQDSEIIKMNGEVFSVNEALAFGIIDEVADQTTGAKLIRDISEIAPGNGFEIYVDNITNAPAVVYYEQV